MRGCLHGIREAWYCVTDGAVTCVGAVETRRSTKWGVKDPGSGSEGGHGAERCGRWGCEDASLSASSTAHLGQTSPDLA